MHPNRAFRFESDTAILDWAVGRGFAHIFAMTPDGPMVAHAPIVAAGPSSLRFHLARANPLTRHLDGTQALLSLAGPDGYITPNWYEDPAVAVPTWNYVTAEIAGTVRVLDENGLVSQLDTLAAAHEPHASPGNPWTRDKMQEANFRAMLKAIVGFELQVTAVRGTAKLSQNKTDTDRARVIVGLSEVGDTDLAGVMGAAT